MENIDYNKYLDKALLTPASSDMFPKSCSKMLRIDRINEFAYLVVLLAQERFFTESNLRGTDFAPRQRHEIMD